MVDTRGIRFTVAYVKTSRNAVMRVISGRPLEKCDGVELIAGWPKWLAGFELAKYSTEGIRLLLTLLTGLRGVVLPPVLDLEPITSPWGGSDPITDRELRHAARKLGIRRLPAEFRRFHMSTKRGPIGQALLTSVTELTLLPAQLLSDIKLVGGESLSKIIEALKEPRLGGFSLVDI